MIYLDNAATSHPKPAECLQRALDKYLRLGASPGRGGYDLAVEAERAVSDVRADVRRFFGGEERNPVCFFYNATEALNSLLQGVAEPGCHIVSTRLEHNAVLRPLHHLRAQGRIEFDLVPFNAEGLVDPVDIAAAFRPHTRYVMLNHASNVTGAIQPVAEIGALCRERGISFFLDVSQSAGLTPVQMEAWHVAGLAFTGHKSLLSPTGIGGLVLNPDLAIQSSRYGGTGVDSSNPFHPREFPFRLEAGTINLFGILALGETLAYVKALPEEVHRQKSDLFMALRDGLSDLERVEVYGPKRLENRLPLLSCNVGGIDPADVAAILDGDFDIAVRAGLHCAPLVHQQLGTSPNGTVRFSLGFFNRKDEIDSAINAMAAIAHVAT
ncbi:MAG: aminotransferase class V-fold PLP-dependent enzyme [Pseudomonadota bacterium]